MEVYYYTEKGKRVKNQDSLLLNSKLITSKDMLTLKKYSKINNKYNKFFIADGMGGYNKGELASSSVLKIFKETFKRKFDKASIIQLVNNSQEYLKYLSLTQNLENLGTTLSGVFFTTDRNIAFNIGDTRIYKLSSKKIEQLSYDHSFGMELVEKKVISKNFLKYHPSKNILTSTISNNDTFKYLNYKEFSFNINEYIFICSDGVWEQLDDSYLIKLLKKEKIFKNICKTILTLIKKSPNDNISFILIKK